MAGNIISGLDLTTVVHAGSAASGSGSTGIGRNGHLGVLGPSDFRGLNSNSFTLTGMIAVRLRTPAGQTMPFDFIEAVAIPGTDKVAVFVISNQQHITLEDGGALFPSDQLITQLRLLGKF